MIDELQRNWLIVNNGLFRMNVIDEKKILMTVDYVRVKDG